MENYKKNGHSKKIPNKKKPPLPLSCSNDATEGSKLLEWRGETAKPMTKLNLFYTNND